MGLSGCLRIRWPSLVRNAGHTILPSRDRLTRMAPRLDTRMAFTIGEHRACTLQALQQSRNVRRGVELHQQVDMGLDHPERMNPRPLLPGDCRQKPGQEPRDGKVDHRRPVSTGPDDVNEQAIAHGLRSTRSARRVGPKSREQGRIP